MKVTVVHAAFETAPQVMAFVDAPCNTVVEALEYAFRHTNNTELISWSMWTNPDVQLVHPIYVDADGNKWGHRSTSVGDYCSVNDQLWRVGGFGFVKAAAIKLGRMGSARTAD